MTALAGLLASSGLVALSACDAADEAFDCAEICGELNSCFDSSINVNDCTSACFEVIDNDSSLDAKADECAACIDGRACSEVGAACPVCAEVAEAFGESGFTGDAGP